MWMAIPAAASAVSGMVSGLSAADDAARKRALAKQTAEGMPLLDLPDQDYSFLNYLGDYDPYSLGTPQQAQYKTVSEDPATRAMEMQALQKLAAQASGAYDMQSQAEQYQALDAANQQANARQGAIRQAMERKGQGGTGTSALMQAQAAQMGANRAQAGTLDAVSKAALQKLAAQGQLLQGAGQVRGQDFNVNRYNTDTINDFNRLNTGLANQWHAQDVANQNAAQLRNTNTRQDIAGRNTGIQNSNIDRRTGRAKAMYDSRVNKVNSIINGINGQAAQASANGPVGNQIGQQGQQLFTNVGSGLEAYRNANGNGGGFTPTPSWKPNGADEENLNGDTFKSWYE